MAMADLRFRIDVAAIQPLARRVGKRTVVDTRTRMPRLGF